MIWTVLGSVDKRPPHAEAQVIPPEIKGIQK